MRFATAGQATPDGKLPAVAWAWAWNQTMSWAMPITVIGATVPSVNPLVW